MGASLRHSTTDSLCARVEAAEVLNSIECNSAARALQESTDTVYVTGGVAPRSSAHLHRMDCSHAAFKLHFNPSGWILSKIILFYWKNRGFASIMKTNNLKKCKKIRIYKCMYLWVVLERKQPICDNVACAYPMFLTNYNLFEKGRAGCRAGSSFNAPGTKGPIKWQNNFTKRDWPAIKTKIFSIKINQKYIYPGYWLIKNLIIIPLKYIFRWKFLLFC